MGGIVFIGDEISAVGYRLAGVKTRTPSVNLLADEFDDACAHADLVMITQEASQHLPSEQLSLAQAEQSPLVLVVEDIRHHKTPPDIGDHIRMILGLDV